MRPVTWIGRLVQIDDAIRSRSSWHWYLIGRKHAEKARPKQIAANPVQLPRSRRGVVANGLGRGDKRKVCQELML